MVDASKEACVITPHELNEQVEPKILIVLRTQMLLGWEVLLHEF